MATPRPVVLVVDADEDTAATLGEDLRRRFGADYEVIVHTDPDPAAELLRRLSREAAHVALVIAALSLAGVSGIDLLSRVRALHPEAARVLLMGWTETGADHRVMQALALGQIDAMCGKPWGNPEARLYPMVSDLLGEHCRARGGEMEVLTVIGEQWSSRSHELRDMFTRNHLPFGFHAHDSDEGRSALERHGLDAEHLPVVTFFDGRFLVQPTNDEIASVLGARTDPGPDLYDVAIIGAGPAGLAAAVYAASEGLRTVLIEKEAIGGQAGASSMIRNYPGFPRGIRGADLASRAFEQASWFGATMVLLREVTQLRAHGDERILTLNDGNEVRAKTVIVATGVSYRRLEAPGVDELSGIGVFYGASMSEAHAMTGERVFVVGGANSAGQAALYLARVARQVTLVVREPSIADGMSDYLIREIEETSNIDVRVDTDVVAARGTHRLEAVICRHRPTGHTQEAECAGLFVLIGAEPHTEWLAGTLDRDPQGYICMGKSPTETSMPGVYAAGDVREASVKRVGPAVGSGAIAVMLVHQYIRKQREARAHPAVEAELSH